MKDPPMPETQNDSATAAPAVPADDMPLDDAVAMLSPRAAKRAKVTAAKEEKGPSLCDLFIARLQLRHGTAPAMAYHLATLEAAWVAKHHPPIKGKRETPQRTLDSQVRVEGKHGRLPVDVVVVKGEDCTAFGLPKEAYIVVGPSGVALTSADVTAAITAAAARVQAKAAAARVAPVAPAAVVAPVAPTAPAAPVAPAADPVTPAAPARGRRA